MALGLVSCGYGIEDGVYDFRRVELHRSTCSLEPPLPAVWEGELQVRGSTVNLSFSDPVFRTVASQAALVGQFLPDRSRDRFLIDSTSEIETGADGSQCLFWAHLQMEAEIHRGDRFKGRMALVYSRQLLAEPSCPFACVTDFSFEAIHR